ncbi:MAG: sensor histidine kinase [Rhodobacteraceae bacterium]|nr:sensor histidine kinase [Paracoccaceae bacterium]
MRRAAALAIYVTMAAAITAAAWWFALNDSLTRLEERGRSDLALAGDRLTGQLQSYREIAVLMADHPDIHAMLLRQAPPEGSDPLLLRAADMTALHELLLVDATGRVVGSSRAVTDKSIAGASYFERALQGALGFHHEIDERTGQRLFVYAAPVFSRGGPVQGAVVVRIATEAVEATWRGEPMIVFFTDREGLAFVSNRDELLLTRRAGTRAAEPGRVVPHQARQIGGHDVWRIDGGRHLPDQALHLTQVLPVIEMTGEALLDIAPAKRFAALVALVSALASLGLGAVLFALLERRRALAERLAVEAEANARLEGRVRERTRELSEANERLRRAQADLVQAGKLSALGQMSAGISHELNQPLMAIQSFAENAGLFLERGQSDKAGDNLGRISDMARRMARIIRNLRAFARQESEGMSNVDLVPIVNAALELTETRLRGAGAAVDWHPPPGPVWVRGGEVRLQQVVVNLLSNAADAMAGPERRIDITLVERAGRVRLTIGDTGAGIADPGRVFDPFYTTKEVGAGEGLGLGLSISYGIVQSFGGSISGRNRPEGGAEFSVELDAAARVEAA